MILTLLAGFFAIGFLVVAHEAGHFLVAKAFKVSVPVFSVGFGPRLFGFSWRGTDYRLSALPFGGYVQIAGMDMFVEGTDLDMSVDPDEDVARRPIWQKIAILLAGPVMNLVLPIGLITAVLMAGEPQVASVIGTVIPDTPAEEAGLQAGDRIVGVDGNAVALWVDVLDRVEEISSDGTEGHTLTLEREDAEGARQFSVPVTAGLIGVDQFGPQFDRFGIDPYLLNTRVGTDDSSSPAAIAGIRQGDRIAAVDGAPVAGWFALMAALTAEEHELTIERVREDDPYAYQDPERITLRRDANDSRTSGLAFENPWGLVPVMLLARAIEPGSPASRAGIESGDRFVSVDGERVRTFDHFIRLVRSAGADLRPGEMPRSIHLVVRRDGEMVGMSLTPEVKVVVGEAYSRPIIGVSALNGKSAALETIRKYYSFPEAFNRSLRETGTILKATMSILGNMVTMKAKPKDNVGGPVAIFQQAGMFAEAGIFSYARFIGFISISVGIINLLPVPVFDGGNIVLYLVEAIRGRSLSIELRERIQMVGVLGIVILMLLVLVNDVSRIL